VGTSSSISAKAEVGVETLPEVPHGAADDLFADRVALGVVAVEQPVRSGALHPRASLQARLSRAGAAQHR